MNKELTNNYQIKQENNFFPMIGFGTYPLQGETCKKSVQAAFEEGYRCFDTATMYQNFEAIGKALKNINRSEILITSKVWPDSQESTKLQADLEGTLKRLMIDYLDVYLLHWPNSKVNLNEIIDNLNDLIERKLVRFVGLSNVTIHHLNKAPGPKYEIRGSKGSFIKFGQDP